MSEKMKQSYGPMTLECSRFGLFTKFFLWFLPLYIYENEGGIIAYKKFRGVLYVLSVVRKPSQDEKARWS